MLSEVDLKDWIRTEAQPLYDVKRDSYIEIAGEDPMLLFFHHIDGMYSYCQTLAGDVVHLAAWTMVKPLLERNSK